MDTELEKSIKEAVKVIGRREFSKFEIKEFLLKKGFAHQIIDETIDYLILKKWYNETKSAIELAEGKARKGFYGPEYITKFLSDKQYPQEIAREAVSSVFKDDEYEYFLAGKTANEKFRRLKRKFIEMNENRYKIRSTLVNHLMSRGFSEKICEDVADKIIDTETC